jgi:polysaccharide export outer membrane protein
VRIRGTTRPAQRAGFAALPAVLPNEAMAGISGLGAGFLLAAALATACGAAKPTYDYQAEQTRSGYKVGPGDVLKISVWKNEQLSQQVTVRPDGAITMPLLGDVPVAGKGVEEISKAIVQQGMRYFNEALNVTVQVGEIKSYRLYVLGEVQKPGEFAPTTQVNVLQALSLAGGFSRFASPDDIMVIRNDGRGTRRIPFVYTQVVRAGDLRQNIVLETGDTVVVP